MEYLDEVDAQGRPTGRVITRQQAHSEGVRHRTSHVWIVRWRDKKPQLLLQKRCAAKDSYPGCYDISSAGHIPAGQDFVESALRELREELSLTVAPEELIDLGLRRFQYTEVFHGREFKDDQISKIFVLRKDIPGEAFTVQQSEIEGVRWFTLDECFAMAQTRRPANCLFTEELQRLADWLAQNPE